VQIDTISLFMNAPTTGEPTPPLTPIILNLLVVRRGQVIDCEPIETASTMLLILIEVTDVHITIRVYFVAESVLFVVGELPFVDSSVLVNSYACIN
jgi:hypothetical protein